MTFYTVERLGPRGGLVYLAAYNADVTAGRDFSASTASAPALTLDQLTRMARSPLWTRGGPRR